MKLLRKNKGEGGCFLGNMGQKNTLKPVNSVKNIYPYYHTV